MNTNQVKRERRQVGLELNQKLDDLLEAAVTAFGGSRASNVIEVLDLCLPIWFEIKRRQKADERERMRIALETALGYAEDSRGQMEAVLKKYYPALPELSNVERDQEETSPRRKRSGVSTS